MRPTLSLVVALIGGIALPQAGEQALKAALQDEYQAFAFYTAVNRRFQDPAPFVQIVQAEANHAQAVARQMRIAGLPVPANPYLRRPNETLAAWYKRLEVPSTLVKAKAMAAQGERENVVLYDRYLADENLPANVRMLLERLRTVSQERHLPAFLGDCPPTCPLGGPGMGQGMGMGMGRGQGMGQGMGPGRMGQGRRGGRDQGNGPANGQGIGRGIPPI